jgi:hypothetical protein
MTTAPTGRTSFPFPHPELTKIKGNPTAIAVKLLQQEVYANTRAVHCTCGGGTNGYLDIAMSAETYAIRIPEQPYIAPNHLGAQPVHTLNATAAQITVVNCQYNAELDDCSQYERVCEAIRQQVLLAVNVTYHDILSHDDFGYADVTIIALLQHLHTHYAHSLLMTWKKIETSYRNHGRQTSPSKICGSASNTFVLLRRLALNLSRIAPSCASRWRH